jgi:uncharacterized protein with NRDE domain
MCTIFFAHKAHPRYSLIIVANRDEFYNRPTKPAHWWMDAPQILAGKDLQAGGTWMGVNKQGKFVAITNYRDPHNIMPDAPSRGDLATRFLLEQDSANQFLQKLSPYAPSYNGFNLLVADQDEMGYLSNYGGEYELLESGIYGLSNHLLDTPWPKVWKNKILFEDLVENNDEFPVNQAFELLKNPETAPDNELPSTGVPYEWEKMLSALFIKGATYGTRVSTVILVGNDGKVQFEERSHEKGKGNRKYEFQIQNTLKKIIQ